MLDKARLIQGILDLNRSARADWLDSFDPAALRSYLDHLQHALEPRGGRSFWERTGETAAVVTRGHAG